MYIVLNKSIQGPVSLVPAGSAQLATCCVAVTHPHGAADIPIFWEQMAICCVAVTDPDRTVDLPIFPAAITDKTITQSSTLLFRILRIILLVIIQYSILFKTGCR